jgi:hypothetical protein
VELSGSCLQSPTHHGKNCTPHKATSLSGPLNWPPGKVAQHFLQRLELPMSLDISCFCEGSFIFISLGSTSEIYKAELNFHVAFHLHVKLSHIFHVHHANTLLVEG